MKIRISDMMDGCCPEAVELGTADMEMSRRIKEDVMKKINTDSRSTRRRNIIRIALIAAVIAALMTSVAFAAGLFSMKQDIVEEGEVPSGYWRYYDEDGVLMEQQKIVFPDAGMVFSFEGPEEPFNRPEFKIGWLPEGEHYEEQAHLGNNKGEWLRSYGQMCSCKDIACQINVSNVNPDGHKYVLNGEPTVVKEENWGDWYVLEIAVDYSESTMHQGEIGNYILMFDEERGYLAIVRGTDDMETLEKIAKNLEIRESDEAYVRLGNPKDEFQIGCIDIGRG